MLPACNDLLAMPTAAELIALVIADLNLGFADTIADGEEPSICAENAAVRATRHWERANHVPDHTVPYELIKQAALVLTKHAEAVRATGFPPLPAGMRPLLLQLLAIGYPAGYPQTRLGNAPDGAIAWQVQSMLDDYADAAARTAFMQAA